MFKDSDGNVVASSYINVLLDNFQMGKQNTKFKSGDLIFVVICHNSLWKLDTGELRPFCVLNELDEMFSEQRVVGIGRGEFNNCKIIWADSNFSGYRITYKSYEFL
ncbi:MAG: hypothetical protein WDA59_00430 [Methanofastidiosum sp.]